MDTAVDNYLTEGLSTEVIVDPSAEAIVDPSTEVIVDPSTEVIVEPSTEVIVNPSTEVVVDPSTEAVVDPSTEVTVNSSTEVVVDPSTEAIVDTNNSLPEYYVAVKSQYILPRISRQSRDANIESKKVCGQNKKRPRDEKLDEELCPSIAQGKDCKWGSKCKFTHDWKSYLEQKSEDLGSTCFNYESYGLCPFGLKCLFGRSHIDYETGKNLERPSQAGGTKPNLKLNELKKEVQTLLRKKKYNFPKKKNLNVAKVPNKDSGILESKVVEVIGTSVSCNIDYVADVLPQEQPTSVSLSVSDTKPVQPLVTVDVITSTVTKSTCTISKDFNNMPYDTPRKLVDFSNKVYVAPLTTVGNLPFRRILKEYGADITCGEMSLALNLIQAHASEWALLRRHASEDCFGIQIAAGNVDHVGKTASLLDTHTYSDFIDLNCGCPLDLVCERGSGASLMTKPKRLGEIVNEISYRTTRSVTVKLRTGWDDKTLSAHKIIPTLQKESIGRLAAIMIHGRTRVQRYHKLADWDYVLQAARSQDLNYPIIPIIGNGDILSYEDWESHKHMINSNLESHESSNELGLCSCAMIGRGALIKPWLPTEIKENRHWDISASERVEMLRRFVNYGLDHWGSDTQGVNITRRFLLEWLSFLHRYVPTGLIEYNKDQTSLIRQRINQRPPNYFGRDDMETWLASSNSNDWLRLSTLFLGPLPENYRFEPKHKSNSYSAPEASELKESSTVIAE